MIASFSIRKKSAPALTRCRCEEREAIAAGVGEDGPPADVRYLCFGEQCFAAVRLYRLERGVNIVGSQVDQQAVGLVFDVDRIVFPCLDKAAARAALGLELHVAVHLVGLDIPAKYLVVELSRLAGIGGGDLDMHDGMACHER